MKLNLATGFVIDSNIFPAYAPSAIDLSQNPIAALPPRFDFVSAFCFFFLRRTLITMISRDGINPNSNG